MSRADAGEERVDEPRVEVGSGWRAKWEGHHMLRAG